MPAYLRFITSLLVAISLTPLQEALSLPLVSFINYRGVWTGELVNTIDQCNQALPSINAKLRIRQMGEKVVIRNPARQRLRGRVRTDGALAAGRQAALTAQVMQTYTLQMKPFKAGTFARLGIYLSNSQSGTTCLMVWDGVLERKVDSQRVTVHSGKNGSYSK